MRIFVSSTFVDLRAERDAAAAALRHSQLVPWGMELFLSEPSSPLEVCLRELRLSDAVVLIIGFHAGSDDYHVATLRTGELRVEWRLSLKSKRRFP
jgi:hypothetical protein